MLLQWARREFRVRYRQSALGLAWSVLQPALLLAVYGTLFTLVLGVSSDRGPYPLFAWCGLTVWSFFATAMQSGANSFITALPIVSKVYFPREVVPLAAVGAVTIDLAISTSVLVVLAATTWTLHLSMVALVPLLFGLVMLAAALGSLLGTATAFLRDIRHAIPLLLQVGFIATPVMYSSSLVPERFRVVYDINPLARLVSAVRACVIDGEFPPTIDLVAIPLVSTLLLLLAMRYVRSVEHRLVDLL